MRFGLDHSITAHTIRESERARIERAINALISKHAARATALDVHSDIARYHTAYETALRDIRAGIASQEVLVDLLAS